MVLVQPPTSRVSVVGLSTPPPPFFTVSYTELNRVHLISEFDYAEPWGIGLWHQYPILWYWSMVYGIGL